MQQHIGCGGIAPERQRRRVRRGHVQIIPERIRLPAQHDRVFLVRVVARQGRIVLVIDAARRTVVIQRTAPGVVGQHDQRRIRRPLNGIVRNDGRPIDRLKTQVGIRRVLPEPQDFQSVAARNGVHRNDRPLVRGRETVRERIHICPRVERISQVLVDVSRPIIAVGSVGGTNLTRRIRQRLAHISGPVRGVGRAESSGKICQRRIRPVPRGQIGRHRAGQQGVRRQRLGQVREDTLKPHIIAGIEPEQGPVGGFAGCEPGVEGIAARDETALHVQRILVIQRGRFGAVQHHRRLGGLVLGGRRRPHVVAVFGRISRPYQIVIGEPVRPQQPLHARRKPVDLQLVLAGRQLVRKQRGRALQ